MLLRIPEQASVLGLKDHRNFVAVCSPSKKPAVLPQNLLGLIMLSNAGSSVKSGPGFPVLYGPVTCPFNAANMASFVFSGLDMRR